MRIAQVAPLYESVPPRLYGGTERVVSYLTEELVALGHEVTLFASGDSQTTAQLRPQSAEALRLSPRCADPIPEHLAMFEEVVRTADDFEMIHFHTEYLHLPLAARMSAPSMTTLHGRLDLSEAERIFRVHRELPYVSISNAQRTPMPWLHWHGTVHHGLPVDLHPFVEEPEPYLAFLGRIAPEKRLDRAIAIARRVGLPLRVAAKLDDANRAYYESEIRALMRDPLVDYIGEVGDADKSELLGNARALLFPIDWPEPFGLVMIEAMACGTPTIAFPCGAVPEVIDHGKTGYLVGSVDEAAAAVDALDTFDRRRCRAVFEERFDTRRMARDYVALYEERMEGDDVSYALSGQRGRREPLSRPSALGSAG